MKRFLEYLSNEFTQTLRFSFRDIIGRARMEYGLNLLWNIFQTKINFFQWDEPIMNLFIIASGTKIYNCEQLMPLKGKNSFVLSLNSEQQSYVLQPLFVSFYYLIFAMWIRAYSENILINFSIRFSVLVVRSSVSFDFLSSFCILWNKYFQFQCWIPRIRQSETYESFSSLPVNLGPGMWVFFCFWWCFFYICLESLVFVAQFHRLCHWKTLSPIFHFSSMFLCSNFCEWWRRRWRR